MAGRFVHGGTQRSALQDREDQKASEQNQYEFEKTDKSEQDDVKKYTERIAEAGDHVMKRSTKTILDDAMDFRLRQREKYNRMYGYDERSQRDRERGRTDRRDTHELERFREHEKYGTEYHTDYKFGGDRSDNKVFATSSTGYRYIPRDPDAPIQANEVKGWLHCWCQTKNLSKPEYEIECFGRPPRQIFKVTVSICSKRGENLGITTTATASSKKDAMSAAAWDYVDQLVDRGLLEQELAPKRCELDEASYGRVTEGNRMLTEDSVFDEEKIASGGGWTLANSMLRLNRFCHHVRVPCEIDIDGSGPEHNRITVGTISVKFHVVGEEVPRHYTHAPVG